jgi:hypothetical protein
MTENCERYIPNPDIPKWNQSYYFNFYDRKSHLGGFIRVGIMENLGETNGFAVFFKDGRPLFTRVNMQFPTLGTGSTQVLKSPVSNYGRPARCKPAGSPSTRRISRSIWSGIYAFRWGTASLTKDGDAIARELAYVHLEGVCNVAGSIRLRDGQIITIDDAGFRDVSCGPRNWAGVRHYRLAWPIFDNGMSVLPSTRSPNMATAIRRSCTTAALAQHRQARGRDRI